MFLYQKTKTSQGDSPPGYLSLNWSSKCMGSWQISFLISDTIYLSQYLVVFTESTQWADSVSKSVCHVCVCATLCVFVCFKRCITPIYKGQKLNRSNTKRFLREKLQNEVGIRISNFGIEIIENCWAYFFVFVFATHCWWIYFKMSSSILLCIVGGLAGSPSAPIPLTFRFPSAPLSLPLITRKLGNTVTRAIKNLAVFNPCQPVSTFFIRFHPVSIVCQNVKPFWTDLNNFQQFSAVFNRFQLFSTIFSHFQLFSVVFSRFNRFQPVLTVFNHFQMFSINFICFQRFSPFSTVLNSFQPIPTILKLFSTVLHWCYYPHTLRVSVSPVCRIVMQCISQSSGSYRLLC